MSTELKEILQQYQLGAISRREFLRQAILVTGSFASANALLGSILGGDANAAPVVSPSDPSIRGQDIQYESKAGPVSGYLARPAASGSYPGIIVIHENRGLNDHIRDVARRFAKEGYIAIAPDFLSHEGGTMKVNPKGGGIKNIREIAPASSVVADNRAALSYLGSLSGVQKNRMGVVGFCWGGGMAFVTAVQVPQIDAAVVYYGSSPKADSLKNLKAPILAHYGGEDERINKGIPATEKAMKQYDKSYTYKIYPGAQHSFNNDTRPDRYNEAAAKEAWQKTLEFFAKHLKG